eukprot:6631314-Alexandrium_andersonii.AAC.1
MHDTAAGLGALLPQLLDAAEDDPLAGRTCASAACKQARGLLTACETLTLDTPGQSKRFPCFPHAVLSR